MRSYPLSALQQQMLTEIYTAIQPALWPDETAQLVARHAVPTGRTRSEQAARCRALTRLEARGLVTRIPRVWEFEGQPVRGYTEAFTLTAAGQAHAEQLYQASAPPTRRARKKTRQHANHTC